MVLITKGNIDTQDIGLLETLCKVVEALIDTLLHASIQFHEVLHGFRTGKGMGATIIELKLSQELSGVCRDPLSLVFLYLRKAYDAVDRKRLIQILEGYGAVTCPCGILETFWGHQKVVPRQNVYHRLAFPSTPVTIQVILVSPSLFNFVLYNLIRTWLSMTIKYQRADHNGMREAAGQCLGLFYTDDGMVGSRDA